MIQRYQTSILRAAFFAALAFAVFMALVPHPPGPAEVNDKAQHSLAFGVLTLLAGAGWPRTPLLRIGERLSFVGALIEVFQSIPVLHRDCDVLDWITDTAAIGLTLLVIAAARAMARRAAG